MRNIHLMGCYRQGEAEINHLHKTVFLQTERYSHLANMFVTFKYFILEVVNWW